MTLLVLLNILLSLCFVQVQAQTGHACGLKEEGTSSIKGIITTNVQLNDKKKSDGRGKRFQITLMNMGVDKTYDSSFIKAKNRWEKVILNDLPDIPAQSGTGHDWFDGVFGKDNAVNIPIDDVLIGYRVTEIDGIPTNSNNILGQAMPIYVRLSSTLSAPTISGIMIFDKADFDSLQKVDVELIIAHEMGHILGIGSNTFRWFCGSLCRIFGHSTYQCSNAKNEYNAYRNHVDFSSDDISTRKKVLTLSLPDCGHWDETNFQSKTSSELMTPVFEKGKYQPLSRVSVAALEDIGYTVNYNGADPWKRKDVSKRLPRWNDSPTVSISLLIGPNQTDSDDLSIYQATESFTLHHEPWNNSSASINVFRRGSDLITREIF